MVVASSDRVAIATYQNLRALKVFSVTLTQGESCVIKLTSLECMFNKNRATLKAGMTERRNGRITERPKITPNPKRRNRGITERRKTPPNPKRWNRRIPERRNIPPKS